LIHSFIHSLIDNILSKGTITVEPAESLSFLESEREFLVGSQLVLPLALYSKGKEMFSRYLYLGVYILSLYYFVYLSFELEYF